jgi:hypothetical protein
MPEDIAMGIFPPPAKLLSTYRLPLWYINVLYILFPYTLTKTRHSPTMSAIRTGVTLFFHDFISISCRHQQFFSDYILSYNFKPRQFPVCLDDHCYGFFQVFACFW